MKVKDRLRAKEPPSNDERWQECSIVELKTDSVIVSLDGEKNELELSKELVELFEDRYNGGKAWCIKKSQ